MTIFKDIILVGGGHAHALLIRQWGMKPMSGVRLTLISPQAQTPYSGMLPGLIAGHYGFDQIHIDLPKVCHWAGVRFIQDKVININPDKKRLSLEGRPELHYDLLSVDIGSTPNHSISGVMEHAFPIKPIAGFYAHWQGVMTSLQENKFDQTVAVVGGGAGSVETILAMAWAVSNNPAIKGKTQFKLLFRSSSLLSSYSKTVIKEVEQACRKMNIALQAGFNVSAVNEGCLESDDGIKQNFDHLFWCTQASAPKWLGETGLTCTSDGFIRVNNKLQSINYPDIFAAGDIAHMDDNPRPKAGVYAVRQAPFLFENLGCKLLGQVLKEYKPQDNFLGLLSLGDKLAIGTRKPFPSFSGRWAWGWKDRIDKKFMDIFQDLPAKAMLINEAKVNPLLIPSEESTEELDTNKRCGGCGAKIGSGILEQVLTELRGTYEPEDASTIAWVSGTLIQTIDHLTAPFDDPYLFGRIAVFHALSDLFAMNAQPHSIHLAVTLPFAGRQAQTRELRLLLQGVLSACAELQVELLGGHSAEGKDLSLALAANGSPKETSFSKQGLREGDLLVLSKPLGSGLILAGQMNNLTEGKDLSNALGWMNKSNQQTASQLAALKAKACTDVTGFGLLGHLSEMLKGSQLQVELLMDQLPCLSGALSLAQVGVRSSLFLQNELSFAKDEAWISLRDSIYWPLLLDPQTSGGLLAGISPDQEKAAKAAGLFVIGVVNK